MTTESKTCLIDFLTKEIARNEKNIGIWEAQTNKPNSSQNSRDDALMRLSNCQGQIAAYKAAIREANAQKAADEKAARNKKVEKAAEEERPVSNKAAFERIIELTDDIGRKESGGDCNDEFAITNISKALSFAFYRMGLKGGISSRIEMSKSLKDISAVCLQNIEDGINANKRQKDQELLEARQ